HLGLPAKRGLVAARILDQLVEAREPAVERVAPRQRHLRMQRVVAVDDPCLRGAATRLVGARLRDRLQQVGHARQRGHHAPHSALRAWSPRQRAGAARGAAIAFNGSVRPGGADTTTSTRRPAAWWSAAIRPIVSQRARVDTLVPPNLTTTQGAPGGSDAARSD